MQMYPGYKLRDVLQEYAISFFAMLNEGYRIRYGNYRMLAQIALGPHMKDSDRRHFMASLDHGARGFDDILNPEQQGDSPEQLKRLLG